MLCVANDFFLPTSRLLSSSVNPELELLRAEYVNGSDLRLEHLQAMSTDARELTKERFAHRYPTSISFALSCGPLLRDRTTQEALAKKIGEDRLNLLDAQRFYQREDFAAAHTKGSLAWSSSNALVRRDAARLIASSLLLMDRTIDAIHFIVSAVVADSSLLQRMPIAKTVPRLDKPYRRKHAGDLTTPIILDFARGYGSKLESYRNYAYEDFLLAHGLTRPTQLSSIVSRFDHTQLVYYLRYLCNPDTMQMSTAFVGTQDYEDERVSVLSLLSDLDPTNAKEYEAESRAITQNQVIRGGVSQVQENKIYVDEAALRKWADVNLRDIYSRYQALRGAQFSGSNVQLIQTLREAFKESYVVLSLPENESIDLLIRMLEKLIDEFLSNTQHGLDCYLSMRVRHGSLAGQLRHPLESHQIITQREGDTNQYSRNEYWLNRAAGLYDDDLLRLDGALREFSQSYDQLIDTYSNEYVQIQSAERSKGLFYLGLAENHVFHLDDAVLSETSFEESSI